MVNTESYDINLRRGFILSTSSRCWHGWQHRHIHAGLLRRSCHRGAITIGAWYLFITSVDRYWFPMAATSSLLEPGAGWCRPPNASSPWWTPDRPCARRMISSPAGCWRIGLRPELPLPGRAGAGRFQPVHCCPARHCAGQPAPAKNSLGKLIARFYEFQVGGAAGRWPTSARTSSGTASPAWHRRPARSCSAAPWPTTFAARGPATSGDPRAGARSVTGVAGHAVRQDQHRRGRSGAQLGMGQRQLVALMRPGAGASHLHPRQGRPPASTRSPGSPISGPST